MQNIFIDYKIEMITRMHYSFPNLNMIEMAISKCLLKNILLIPQKPEEIFPNDPVKQLDAMGIKLNENGKREPYLMSE